MDRYELFMDVSGEINHLLVEQGKITLIPMDVAAEEEAMRITGHEDEAQLISFYENIIRVGKRVSTTQITPNKYVEYFSSCLEKGISVLHLCLSSGLSSSFSSAMVASEMLKEKYPNAVFMPIDSIRATGGMSIIADRMIANKEKGMSIQENYDDIENLKHKVITTGFIDDLDTLKRGGRISPTIAFVGKLLNIKPIIKITEDGKLDMFDKKRGQMLSMKVLLDLLKEKISPDCKKVFITHTNEMRLSNRLKEQIIELFPDVDVEILFLSPIIGAHLGIGSVVVSYFAK